MLQIDLKNSNVIPLLLILPVMVYMSVSFFNMEILLMSFVALALMLVSFVISLFLLIRKREITLFGFVVISLLLLILTTSFIYGNSWKDWIYILGCITCYQILLYYYRDNTKVLIFGAWGAISVVVYAQLLQCLLHPELWVLEKAEINGFLLGGNHNQMGSRIVVAIALGCICVNYTKWCLLNLIPLVITSIALLFMVQSMTALSSVILLTVLCFINNKRVLFFSDFLILVGVVLFQTIVCFSGTGLENNELASWFVKDVLNKDMTFTGRTVMWDSALRIIPDSPLVGYGYVDKEWYYSNMSTLAIGAHNFILNLIIYAGILGLFTYLILIAMSIKNLLYQNDVIALKLLACFATMSIMMLFEVYEMQLVFFLLTIMYYYKSPINRLIDARKYE